MLDQEDVPTRFARLLVTLVLASIATLTPARSWCQRASASGSPNLVAAIIANYAAIVATSSAEVASGLPGARLLPVSADAFSPDGIAPLIVFERDARGRVTGYVQQSPDGSVVRARRLPDVGDASHASHASQSGAPGRAPHLPQSPRPPR